MPSDIPTTLCDESRRNLEQFVTQTLVTLAVCHTHFGHTSTHEVNKQAYMYSACHKKPCIRRVQHTESEVSTPRSKKEDQDRNTTNAKTSHKMFSTMDLPSPHVETEESWSRSSSEEDKIKSKNKAHDASLTVKAENNIKQNAVHKYKCKEEQCSPISPEGKKRYDRKFLLQLQNAPQSVMQPANLPDIPDIIIEKHSFGPFPRDCADVGNIADFTTGYAWTSKSLSKSSYQGKDAPWRGISQEKNASLPMQKDMSLHTADGCRKDEEQKNKPAKSEDSTLRAKKENQNQKTTKAKTPDKKVGTVGKPSSHVDGEETLSSSSLEERMPKLENKANVASITKKTEKNKKQKATLKNKYKEEQCSPISPEGKKRYDRKFLLQLQNAPQSMMKPANLPDIPEIIIEKPSDSEYIQLASRGGTALLGWFRGSIEDGARSEEGERTHLPINRTVVAQRQSQETWGRHEPECAKTMEKPSTPVLDHMTNQMGSRTRAIVEKYLHIQDVMLGDSENIQLGPNGGAARLGWFKGSTGGWTISQEGERPNTSGNRFSALSKADKSEDDGSHRGGERGGFGQPGPPVNHPSQESGREKAIVAAKTIVAERPSEERSGGCEPECAKTMEKPFTPVLELMDDQMGSKTRAIMDEYLHIQDVGEAISRVQELSSSSSLHLFVYNALDQVLEMSEVARKQTGLLLHDLVKKNVILMDTYVRGLKEILMFAEDMEIDIPKIWEYFGQLIGPMVQDGSVPLGFLKQVCEPLRANGKSGILVAEILHDASHREGHEKVARLWAESGLHWSDFVPYDQIDQFLADKKLEFTKILINLSTSMPITDIKENLHNIILRSCSNEEVFDWIEEHVDDPMIKHKHFIHALMSAVCRSAIAVDGKNMMKVDKSKIQRRNNLLQKYLNYQVEFELQALYALQALVHTLGHPPGVLRELFDILYDEDIISEDAFIRWEKSEDPQEQEGKSMAMKQVVQFFIWLKDAEDEESDCDLHQESSHHCNDGQRGSISQEKLESLLIQKDISLHNVYTIKSPQKEEEELDSKPQSNNQDKDGSGWHISQTKTESISIQKGNTQKQVEDDARKSLQEEEEKGAEEDEGEEEKVAEEVEGEEEQQNTEPRSSHQDKDCSEQSMSQENNESLSIQKVINLNHAEDDARKSTQEEEEGNEVEEEAEEEQNSELQSSHQDKDGSEQSILLEKNKSLLIQRNTNLNQAENDSRKSQQEEKKDKGQKNSETSYPNQPSMQPPSYQMVHPQPGQGMYTVPQHMIMPQQMMFMPKAHYSSPGTHVRMPLSDYPNHPNMQPTNYLMGQPPPGPEMYGAPQQMTIPQQQQMSTPKQMMFMPLAQYGSVGTQVKMPMLYYPNQCSSHPPSYPMVHPQPGQRFYTAPQEIMFTQPGPYDSAGTHVSMPVNNCLLRRDDNNRTSDQIYGKVVQDEQNHTLVLQNLPPDITRDENKHVEERDEQSVRSLLSGDNAQRIIHPEESSSSRKASTKSPEWDIMQLEKEKLKSEIELINVKYKKIIEEIELLKLQKEFLKLQINSFS